MRTAVGQGVGVHGHFLYLRFDAPAARSGARTASASHSCDRSLLQHVGARARLGRRNEGRGERPFPYPDHDLEILQAVRRRGTSVPLPMAGGSAPSSRAEIGAGFLGLAASGSAAAANCSDRCGARRDRGPSPIPSSVQAGEPLLRPRARGSLAEVARRHMPPVQIRGIARPGAQYLAHREHEARRASRRLASSTMKAQRRIVVAGSVGGVELGREFAQVLGERMTACGCGASSTTSGSRSMRRSAAVVRRGEPGRTQARRARRRGAKRADE